MTRIQMENIKHNQLTSNFLTQNQYIINNNRRGKFYNFENPNFLNLGVNFS
jgi:hypothetical protein